MRPKLAFAMSPGKTRFVFDAAALARLRELCEVLSNDPLHDFETPPARDILRETEILVTGWGCPFISREVVAAAPALKLIAHAAGTVKYHLDPVVFEAGIAVTNSVAANAVPVAEYTLAMIILAAIIRLPRASQLAIAIILIAGHNLLDNIHVAGTGDDRPPAQALGAQDARQDDRGQHVRHQEERGRDREPRHQHALVERVERARGPTEHEEQRPDEDPVGEDVAGDSPEAGRARRPGGWRRSRPPHLSAAQFSDR